MTFGEKLRVLRRRDGYTQAELAELLGITPRTLINYERGRCLDRSGRNFSPQFVAVGVKKRSQTTMKSMVL